ncbi:hypothetical protein GLU60_02860 [Nanohaloarchaea archaeon H01]|nr:hypothetical protein [Nanohaloarchaea archaeon H01]
MGIETNQGSTEWEYGDQETYDDVLDWFNDNDIGNSIAVGLIDEAESLYEKVEENYLEAEGVLETGSTQPKASDFEDESGSHEGIIGRALTALAEMPDKLTELDYWSENSNSNANRYDMTSVDYERLCGVLEAVTRIDDEDLDWTTY